MTGNDGAANICVKITTRQYHPETGDKLAENFVIADQRDLAVALSSMMGARPFDHPLDREPELRPVVVMRVEWLRASLLQHRTGPLRQVISGMDRCPTCWRPSQSPNYQREKPKKNQNGNVCGFTARCR